MAKNKNNKTSVKDVEVVEEIEEVEEIDEDEVEDEEEVNDSKKDFQIDDEEELITLEDRIINIEKKANMTFVLSIIIMIICVLTMVFVINGNDSNSEATSGNAQSSEESSSTYDTSSFTTIKGTDIKSLSKGKTLVLWIGRQGCGYCSAFAPLIEAVAKQNNIDVKYIDFADMVDLNTGTVSDTESYDAIKNLTGEGTWKDFGKKAVTGTPYTLIIKNNKIIGGIGGYAETTSIEQAFKDAGLIK